MSLVEEIDGWIPRETVMILNSLDDLRIELNRMHSADPSSLVLHPLVKLDDGSLRRVVAMDRPPESFNVTIFELRPKTVPE